MGEDEKPRNSAHNNDGNSAEGERIKSINNTTAEVNSSAVSVSEPNLKIAEKAFSDYAVEQLTYRNLFVREAFLSGDRKTFDNDVHSELDTLLTNADADTLGCTKEEYLLIYAEILQDGEYREKLYNSIADKAYNGHIEQNKNDNVLHISQAEQDNIRNFQITDEAIGEGGVKTKFQNNINAIKLVKLLDESNRQASPEEQQTLSKYVGWGGMPQAFDSQNQNWTKEYAQLKELLTDKEYAAARGSTLNAHYTSPVVIEAIYKAIGNMGFKGGNILEPSMGTGNFFGCMPQSLAEKSNLHGVELDEITGKIAKQLYPNASISISGFEETHFQNNQFDVAVGNVPFGNYGVADKDYDKHNFNIHDYFFVKSLDKIAPGGIVAFVTSKGTLDKQNPKVREYLAERAELVGAIRLPNNAFKSNANTEVTADIVFLKKRPELVVGTPDWVFTSQNADGISINNYFINNPHMILGTMKQGNKMYGGNDTTCVPFENADLKEQLNKAISFLKADIAVQKKEAQAAEKSGIIPAVSSVRNFTYAVHNDKLYYRENDIMKQVETTDKKLERILGMNNIRNTMRQLIDAQAESCSDEQLMFLQEKLNNVYDRFVSENGAVSSKANSVFSDDDDYNMLCALEDVNTQTKEVTKSAFFSKRTISPQIEITSTETVEEAFQVSLDKKGCIDIGYISVLSGGDS